MVSPVLFVSVNLIRINKIKIATKGVDAQLVVLNIFHDICDNIHCNFAVFTIFSNRFVIMIAVLFMIFSLHFAQRVSNIVKNFEKSTKLTPCSNSKCLEYVVKIQ